MVHKRHIIPVIALLATCCQLVLVTRPVLSDDVSGVISGYVLDERSLPISHAMVSISAVDAAHGVRVTDSKGFFTFLGLLPGRYYVVASKDNRALCSGSLSVLVGVTTNIRVTLRPHRRSTSACSFSQPEYGAIY